MHEVTDIQQKRSMYVWRPSGWTEGQGQILGRYICRCGYSTCWYAAEWRAKRNIDAHIANATKREATAC